MSIDIFRKICDIVTGLLASGAEPLASVTKKLQSSSRQQFIDDDESYRTESHIEAAHCLKRVSYKHFLSLVL